MQRSGMVGLVYCLLVSMILAFTACGNPPDATTPDATTPDATPTPDAPKAITSFSLYDGITFSGIINESAGTIALTVHDMDLSAAHSPAFTCTGSSITVNNIEQTSNVSMQVFSDPVEYLVTATDGKTKTYTVTVTSVPETNNELTSLAIAGTAALDPGAAPSGTPANTCAYGISVPYDTGSLSLTAVKANYFAELAYVVNSTENAVPDAGTFTSFPSGTATNVAITANATNNSQFLWVRCTSEADVDKFFRMAIAFQGPTFLSFGAPSAAGGGDIVSDSTNTVSLPFAYNASLTNVVPSFAVPTGVVVTVSGTTQESGVNYQNFDASFDGFATIDPVSYLLTAPNGQTRTYAVKSVPLPKYCTSFDLLSGGAATVNGTYLAGQTVNYANGVSLTVGASSTGCSLSNDPTFNFGDPPRPRKVTVDATSTITLAVTGDCQIAVFLTSAASQTVSATASSGTLNETATTFTGTNGWWINYTGSAGTITFTPDGTVGFHGIWVQY